MEALTLNFFKFLILKKDSFKINSTEKRNAWAMRRNANDHDPRDFWAAGEQLGRINRSDDKNEHDAVEVGVAAEARVALGRARKFHASLRQTDSRCVVPLGRRRRKFWHKNCYFLKFLKCVFQ